MQATHHHHHHHHHSLSFLRESSRHHRDHVWERVLPCSHVLAKLNPSSFSKRGRGERHEAVEGECAYLNGGKDVNSCVWGKGQSTNIMVWCVRTSARHRHTYQVRQTNATPSSPPIRIHRCTPTPLPTFTPIHIHSVAQRIRTSLHARNRMQPSFIHASPLLLHHHAWCAFF